MATGGSSEEDGPLLKSLRQFYSGLWYNAGMKSFVHLKELRKKYLPLSLKDSVIFLVAMAAGAFVCSLLQRITTSDYHVPLIFVLIVLIIALLTDGYFYGLLAAIVSVPAVNWAFTYPYMKLDFSVYGYPLTFLTMLAVGIASSMLATRIKEQEQLRSESEREKMRANLLRSVSHDLRTPLTAISGSVSAVIDNPEMPPDEKRELLINARDDADWLYRMVENLLSITRISGENAGDFRKTPEAVEEVVGEATAKFRRKNPDVRINVSCPEEIVFAPMDPLLIEQVIINLLENGVIHGRTTDTIDLIAEKEGGYVSVTVRDNGVGIEAKKLSHLFDGSVSLLAGDGNRFAGIGLTVCKTIIDAHGGRIEARNVNSGGAEFKFYLPLEADNECP